MLEIVKNFTMGLGSHILKGKISLKGQIFVGINFGKQPGQKLFFAGIDFHE